jgi:hypothetical protein
VSAGTRGVFASRGLRWHGENVKVLSQPVICKKAIEKEEEEGEDGLFELVMTLLLTENEFAIFCCLRRRRPILSEKERSWNSGTGPVLGCVQINQRWFNLSRKTWMKMTHVHTQPITAGA